MNVHLLGTYGSTIVIYGVGFYTPFKYWMGYCQPSWTPLSTQPPDDVDKTWTFTKTSTAFIISCNGVEVLNYVFSDSSESNCASKWSQDIVYVKFASYDEASDYYYKLPAGMK